MVSKLSILFILSLWVLIVTLKNILKLSLLTFEFSNIKIFFFVYTGYLKYFISWLLLKVVTAYILLKNSSLYLSWKPKFNRLPFND